MGSDTAAKWHIVISTAFLALAGVVWVAAMVEVRFPGTLTGPFSYGRIRPIALLLAVMGWLTLSLVGGIYYLLPRLTGARLRGEGLALAGGVATALVTVVGAVVVLLGWGDGTGPFSLPWWVSLPLFLTLLTPMLVTISTVRHRQEPNIYVSLWYAMGGVVWLPLLYLVGALPAPSAMGGALSESVALFGLANLWVVGMGIGLAYYALVKETGNPLASRQLARVGFWSLAFASAWSGVAPLVFGPVPGWLEAVAFLMTLALPVSALANAANFALTADQFWAERRTRPVVAAALAGVFFALMTAASDQLRRRPFRGGGGGSHAVLGRCALRCPVRSRRAASGGLVVSGASVDHWPEDGRSGAGPASSALHLLGGGLDFRPVGGRRTDVGLRLDGRVLYRCQPHRGWLGESGGDGLVAGGIVHTVGSAGAGRSALLLFGGVEDLHLWTTGRPGDSRFGR